MGDGAIPAKQTHSSSRSLRSAGSLEGYLANPIGCYIAGANAAAFWVSETLNGLSFWGQPDQADVEMIVKAVRAGPGPCARPHASVVDVRRLRSLDLTAFDRLWSGLASHFAALGPLITRRAVISPGNSSGTTVANLFRFVGFESVEGSFTDPAKALGWIGVDDPVVIEDLDRIPSERSTVEDLRTFLEASPASRSADAARHLGLSPRTFQRRLQELGTTFQREVNDAHLLKAKRLMRDTAQPLKWVAIESGYASLQHFSSSFRTQMGLSPREWRSGAPANAQRDANETPGAIAQPVGATP